MDPHQLHCTYPAQLVWRKALGRGAVALLLMNIDDAPADISVDLGAAGLNCAWPPPVIMTMMR